MERTPLTAPVSLTIQEPCPKKWDELVGDARKRFCSQCSLHVHDAAQMTAREAQELVRGTSSRVCLRIQYDACGAPVHLDSATAVASTRPKTRAARLAHWALSTAAGLLAACNGAVAPGAAGEPAPGGNGFEPSTKMGKVVSTVMGRMSISADVQLERLGEVVVPVPAIESPPGPGGQ